MNANKKKAVVGAVAAMVLVFAGLFATGAIVSKSADSQASTQLAKDSEVRPDIDDVNDSSTLDEKEDNTNDEEDSGIESSNADFESVPAVQPASTGSVSKEDAIKIALTATSGNVTDVEEEIVDASAVYTVQVTKDSLETDVKIEKSTGRILKIESDTKADDKDDTEESTDANDINEDSTLDANADEKDDGTKESDDETSDADVGLVAAVPQPFSPGAVTKEDAIKIALTTASGKVTDVEEEHVGASQVYSVELRNNGLETDVKIEKSTGRILRIESDERGG